MAGCAANKTTGTAYCSEGDCAVDGDTLTVYFAKKLVGGAAMDKITQYVYCGVGECASDLPAGKIY